MKTLFQIEIPKRGSHCSSCNSLLEPETEYGSVITSADGMVRKDYCSSCCEQTEGGLAHWRGVVPKRMKEEPLPKDREERALVLLKRMLGDEEASHAEAFVLALYLHRKKMLHLRQEMTRDEGQVYFLYEVVDTEEMLAVPKVKISSSEVDQLQKKVAVILKPET